MKNLNRFILLTTFLLVLAAGVVLGRLWGRLPDHSAGRGNAPSWLADQLGLSQEQRQKMDAIWAQTRKKMGEAMKSVHELDQQRDQAINALLSPDQKARYDRLLQEFHARRQELDRKRAALIREAEAKSRALLDAQQAKTWDSVTQQWRHRRSGRHGPPGTTRPASQPVAESDQ